MNATPGKKINDVRDPEHSEIDEPRALEALESLLECAESGVEDVSFDPALSSEIVAMLQSREYLGRIASLSSDAERLKHLFALP